MNFKRLLYLIFKMDDFSDIVLYSVFLLFSGFAGLFTLGYFIDFVRIASEPLSKILGADWNPFTNSWVLFLVYLLFSLFFFILFYVLYNMGKFSKPSISRMMFKEIIITLLILVLLKGIEQYILNTNSYLIYVLFIAIYLTILLFFICYFLSFILNLFNFVIKKNIPIKENFQSAHLKLKELIENSYKNITVKPQEIVVKTRLMDIYIITNYYTEGIKELKNSYGNAIEFDSIICLDSEVNLNEILDQFKLYR